MSFTKAANQLTISQQGISKIISRMEEELDVPLFIRKNARLELTEYGKLFLQSSLNILKEYNSITEQIAVMKAHNSVSISLYVPMGMMHLFPIDAINEYSSIHPEIDLCIQQATDIECEEALVNGQADLAFCSLPLDTTVFTLHSRKCYPVRFLMSERNPLSRLKAISADKLKKERFITIDAKNKCGDDFNRRCEKAGFRPNIFMRTYDLAMIMNTCLKNSGISFWLGENYDVPKGLVLVPEDPPAYWECALVTLAHRELGPAVKELINYLNS